MKIGRLKMKNRITILLLLLIPVFAFALEPTIALPPVLLELEDSTIDEIDTPLPQIILPEVAEIEVVLPDLANPEVDLTLLLPDEKALEIDADATSQGHFFDVTVGVGTLASVVAGLDWHYVNDSGLSTKMKFLHDNSMFWNYLPISENRIARTEDFSFDLDYQNEEIREMFDLSLSENQLWNQNKIATMESLTWRNLSIQNRSEHFFDEGLSVRTKLGIQSSIFSENYGNNSRDYSAIMPGLGISLKRDELEFVLDFDYRASGEIGLPQSESDHFLKFFMDFLVPLPYKLKLSGGFGLAWSNDETQNVYNHEFFGITLPFSVKLAGEPFDFFEFSVEGGFKEWSEDYAALQEELRWMQFSRLELGQGWYADANFRFPIKKIATIEAGLEYKNSHRLNYLNTSTLSSGLIEVLQASGETLHLFAGAEVIPNDYISLELDWRGEVLSTLPLATPEHELAFNVKYKIPDEWFGGNMRLGFDYYEEARIPEWDLGFYFKFKEKYTLNIAATDLLAGIYGKEGRPGRGLFVEEGSALALLLKISL